MQQAPACTAAELAAIRLVIFDVDGVLTDGTLYYGDQGEVLKPFNVKDGVGFRLLQHHGIAIGVITAKRSAPLAKRMHDLRVTHFYPGSQDKLATLRTLTTTLGITNVDVAYVGDDVLDLPAMQHVGLAIAPADAHSLVQRQARCVTTAVGGSGVAREVADWLIGARMDLPTAYEEWLGVKRVQ